MIVCSEGGSEEFSEGCSKLGIISKTLKYDKIGNKKETMKGTSSAGRATLGDTELIRCLRIGGGGHRTFQFRTFGQNFRLGLGHHTRF